MSKSPRTSILINDVTTFSAAAKDSPTSQVNTIRDVSRRRTIFTNDQEVFVDTQMPLILLSDTNLSVRFNGTGLTRVTSEKKSTYMRNMETSSQPTQSQSPSKKLEPLDISEHVSDKPPSDAFKTPKSIPHLKKEVSEKGSVGTSGMKESSYHNNDEVDIFNGNKIEIIEEMDSRKLFVKIILNSKIYNIIYTFLVLYALFADDIRQIFLDSRTDTLFDVFTFICMAAFTLEIVLYWYTDRTYRWSLFFFLDTVSTLSFLINLSFLSSTLLPAGTTNAAQLARASRASRIGTRAGRIVRLVRMFRMTKIFEFLKLKKKKGDENKVFPTNSSQQSEIMRLDNSGGIRMDGSIAPTPRRSAFDFDLSSNRLPKSPSMRGPARNSLTLPRQNSLDKIEELRDKFDKPAGENVLRRAKTMLPQANAEENEEERELKESRVGKKLSDLTTKRVVVIVLLMLTLLPMFASTFYFEKNASDAYEVRLLGKLLDSSTVSQPTKDKALEKYLSQEKKANPALVSLTWGTKVLYKDDSVNIDHLRREEQTKNTVKTSQGDLVSITNGKPNSDKESLLSLGRNFFVIIVLASAALLFSKDANELVLRPIERMIEKVNMIARNPLLAKNQALIGERNDGFENETVQIENAIVKIGGLLALGYGDAGSMIITKNVAESGDLNPMLSGRKIAAIFGFCDIRNFTDATEVLQEGVMVFVNSIAEIVHSTVDKYCGAANKNIGDAFLLAWKLPDEDIMEYEDGTLMINPSRTVNNLADLSLLSFLKINAKINKDPVMLEYRDNASLNARLPNYKVKMGFGLHVGWAIEGAIGSGFKIDASYLSPNVNLASRLEAATKQYGVPLLFSGELYQKMSKKMQAKTRLIDIVTVKGSVQPMEIYTCDMDMNDLIAGRDRRKMSKRERDEKHYAQKDLFEDMLYFGEAASILEMDREIQHLLRHQDPIFNELFNLGFSGYVEGDWSMAKKKFEECLALKNDDGPTRNLMAFLAESDFISPEDWKGFRILTDK